MSCCARVPWKAIVLPIITLIVLLFHVDTPFADCTVKEQQRLIAHDGPKDAARFGESLSMSGDIIVVGASGDDEAGSAAGAVYVYRFDGSAWVEEQKLTASDASPGDVFGRAVSVNADGDLIVVGATGTDDMGNGSGAAYVFRFNGSMWEEQQKLTAVDGAADDGFGVSVSIGGNVLLVGASGDDDAGDFSGSAYAFRFNGSAWVEEQKLTPIDAAALDEFGRSVSVDGEVALVGADRNDDMGVDSGSVYVFRYDGVSWVEEQKLTASDGSPVDNFGRSVSLSGDVAIVGAWGDDDMGSESGAAYVFRFDGSLWEEQQKLTASDGHAGEAFGVSVSVDGDVAVVGAHAAPTVGFGAAYIFRFNGSTWVEMERLTPSDGAFDDYFGWSVAASRDVAVVGAAYNSNGEAHCASAYLYPSLADLRCRCGTVDLGAGAIAADILAVNGDSGTPVERTVTVSVGSPIEVFMDTPPSGPDFAPFALYAWLAKPDASTAAPQPFDLGTMCFPTFLSGRHPLPFRVWNNAGHETRFGTPSPHLHSEPAPSVVISSVQGWPRPITVTLQGFITDNGSAAAGPASITNAVILNVVDSR